MLKKILIVAVVLFAVLLVVIATRPGEFTVSRSAVISAPPAEVFPQVNVMKNWAAWSPWAKLDPNMKVTYSGPESGVGSAYACEGDSNVGAGNMTITESRPNEALRMRLEFIKPFAGVNDTAFDFQPAPGNSTAVTWTMSGKANFMSKAIGLFIDMDKMVGSSFEQGLASIQSIVGKKPAAP